MCFVFMALIWCSFVRGCALCVTGPLCHRAVASQGLCVIGPLCHRVRVRVRRPTNKVYKLS